MIKIPVHKRQDFFKPQRRLARKLPAVVFLLLFLFGYNLTTAILQRSNAQATVTPTTTVTPTIGSPGCPGVPPGSIPTLPCDASGAASNIKTYLTDTLLDDLKDSAKDLEEKLGDLNDGMIKDMLKRLNTTEEDIISWWKTMWNYNLYPSLQAMTDQLTAAIASQTSTLQAVADAESQAGDTKRALENSAVETKLTQAPSTKNCTTATVAGGLGTVASTSKAIRRAFEKKSQRTGLNKKGTKGATGAIAAERERYEDYKELFCDKDGNGGRNDCPTTSTADPKYINADAKPTEIISSQLTIPVGKTEDPEGKMIKTVETNLDNMAGVPSSDPISLGALKSSTGQQTFLDRRSYLARHAAVRAVPQLITGWRMPGSKTGEWLTSLRKGAGIPLKDVSDNPSYREVIHALAVDRFNSGRYAEGMIKGEAEIEMEKLTLNAFYLMQLRDYYELLERTALVLAVQVAMMVDQAPAPGASAVVPLKKGGEE